MYTERLKDSDSLWSSLSSNYVFQFADILLILDTDIYCLFVAGYGNDGRMNGDIPSGVPVTTLSGLATLTQCK